MYILLYSLLDLLSSTLSCLCTSRLNQQCRFCDMNGLSHCTLDRIDVQICQIQVVFLKWICRNTVCLHAILHLSWKLVACFDGLWRATTTNKFIVSVVQPPQGSLCISRICASSHANVVQKRYLALKTWQAVKKGAAFSVWSHKCDRRLQEEDPRLAA